MTSIFAAIAVLAVLVAIHELGHFAAARLQGIHANRFSLGFGPVLLKYQGSQTEYAIRAIPLGGFVGFPDDDPDSEIDENDPDLLTNRPIMDRAIVISAGVIANLIFAYFLLVGQAYTVGFPNFNYQAGVRISELAPGNDSTSPAVVAGLQAQDLILSIDQTTLPASDQALPQLISHITSHSNQEVAIKVERDGQIIETTITPAEGADGKGRIGVVLSPHGVVVNEKATNFLSGLTMGAEEYERVINLTGQGFWQLISNFQETSNQVAGPVAIVAVGAKLADDSLSNLFQFGALISINLAVINILPLPALDGGQLAFLFMEALRGKPLPDRLQNGIMQTGIFLLLGLGMFLIVRDTVNLEEIQRLLD